MACGIDKDREKLEVFPYHEYHGITDDPIDPLFELDCQPYYASEDHTKEIADERKWRKVMVCHECFHKLDPDMWISIGCWESLDPVTPFMELPLL